jgi:hypothetical protein
METLLSLYEMAHPEYVPYITAAITIAAGVAIVLPPPADTGVRSWAAYGAAYRGVQWVALNFGHARNANDPKAKPNSAAQVGGG